MKKFETNNGDEINANPPEERDDVRNNAERDIRNAEQSQRTVENDPQTNSKGMIFMCDQCDFKSRKEHIITEHIQADHSPSPKKRMYV